MSDLKDYMNAVAGQLIYLDTRNIDGHKYARTPNMGFNSKRCKSCVNFERCKMFRLRGAMDKACEDYVSKKKRR